MDHRTASVLIASLMKAGETLSQVAQALESITDEDEKRPLKRLLGEAMALVGVDMLRPIIRQHPDLDPD